MSLSAKCVRVTTAHATRAATLRANKSECEVMGLCLSQDVVGARLSRKKHLCTSLSELLPHLRAHVTVVRRARGLRMRRMRVRTSAIMRLRK